MSAPQHPSNARNAPEGVILYVDDDPGNRTVFKHSLGHAFHIETAGSADEALALLTHKAVAVVVTDQRMPGRSGNQLLEEVQQRWPHVVRIVVTAFPDVEPLAWAVNKGLAARYLIKPWDRDEIESTLRWALEAHALCAYGTEVQDRLLKSERLITIGNIGSALLHDLAQPATYLLTNAKRLQQLCVGLPELRRWLDTHGGMLPPDIRASLDALAAEQPEILDDMRAGCEIIAELTQGILRLLEVSADEADHNATVALDEVLPYCLSVCRRTLKHLGVAFVCELPSPLPRVGMRFAELAQVLINLVLNAAQAFEPSPTPSLGREPPRVVVDLTVSRERVLFAIRDNGPGMNAQILANAVQPFFTTRHGGTGLGLPQSRRLVTMRGGHFSIESQIGKGTTVTFQLPCVEPLEPLR